MEQVKAPQAAPAANKTAPKEIKLLGIRANTPVIMRAAALTLLALTLLGIGIAFYRSRNNVGFHMISDMPQLSPDVVGEVTGYERREMEGDVMKYYIKADKAVTFADNHQELENALIQVYDEKGEQHDSIKSDKAVYIPKQDDSKLFDAYFVGNVNIETRDGLKVKTDALSYNRETEIAKSEQTVEFERDNIKGKSTGVIVKVKEKRLELLKDVDIEANGNNKEMAEVKLQEGKLKAVSAIYKHNEGILELNQNVQINVVPNGSGELKQPTDIKSDKAVVTFVEKQVKTADLSGSVEIFAKPGNGNPNYTKTNSNYATANFENELRRVDLRENVYIESTENNSPTKMWAQNAVYTKPEERFELSNNVKIESVKDSQPTNITSQNAVYIKPQDRFELANNVQITTVADGKQTVITGQNAVYEQTARNVDLTGGAQITQGGDIIKGDAMNARLYPDKKVQTAVARGNAYLKQTTPERVTGVSSNEINAFFNGAQQIERAVVGQNGNVVILPANQAEYSKFGLSAPKSIELLFRANENESVLSQMKTDGRTTIVMNAPPNNPKASAKKLTADNIVTVMNQNGRDLVRAEAVGNAEMYVEPVQSAPDSYKSVINAPRFDCDFYETGNNPRVCVAKTNAKAVMTPTAASAGRGVRTLTADVLTANFNQNTQDLQQMDAAGNAKFNELDRNGTADTFNYTANDETVRLRGGEPTVWDSRARAKAGEIDWDTKNQKSSLRGKVSTTYYSQQQTNGSTPFGNTKAPVYITADNAQFDHRNEVGVYKGNARAWQENNFVRAEELVLRQKEKRMDGAGNVQSLLYNTSRKENGKTVNQPAFASSNKIFYSDNDRLLHYEENVDIRQGTDRITAGVADIYLNEGNELKQTVLQNNVVLTQPNRRASGTWAQYTSADETVVLRGNPASVQDSQQGSMQGAQLTVLMNENKVITQGSPKGTSGRTRSVYKVRNP